MKGYVANIGDITNANSNFRQVLYTAKHCQLVIMNLKPGEEIGEEIHELDQFLRLESGEGEVVLNGETSEIKVEFAVIVPAGVKHNIINTGQTDLKLYTIYSPPEHLDGTVHKTKKDAQTAEEHFDGHTTE